MITEFCHYLSTYTTWCTVFALPLFYILFVSYKRNRYKVFVPF